MNDEKDNVGGGEEIKDLRLPMDTPLLQKLEYVMKHYGIINKTEAIRVLITLRYNEIKKETEPSHVLITLRDDQEKEKKKKDI